MGIGEWTRERLAELRGAWNPQFLRILVARKRGLAPGARIPRLERRVDRVGIDEDRLRRYREVCGFSTGGELLPVSYPQLLAFPLQLELMLDPAFSLPLLGLIHVRSAITQQRAIAGGAELAIACSIGEQREARRGFEVELLTEISVGGELRWRSTTTLLSRQKRAVHEERPREPQRWGEAGAEEQRVEVASDLGRRYAFCSGDLNPIHLHPLVARLFGFRSAIAHGMWTLARSLAGLEESGHRFAGGVQLGCDFKLPVLLPATLRLRRWRDGAVTHFAMLSEDGERPHLVAQIAPLQG